MQVGLWFTISLGRRQRADPKFLLPRICSAGGVTRRDVGKIKIDKTEARFGIFANKAAGYAKQMKQPGSHEKGIKISPAGETREKSRQAKPKFTQDSKPKRSA